ncbi:hypothetical protein K438DRAFT_1965436 [Mycena galopus ATCC 62051]|nr:hypothetical protein K438DRAFT_1965436 [Mycena galopus ATCC 62051]
MATQQKSERFCALDADLTILSSDGVIFKVHRKNLEVHSDIFADAEHITGTGNGGDESVKLSESAAVLDLLFQYMYRQPQPDLRIVDFPVAAALAEAAGKYMVYSAVPAVISRMREGVSEHPLDVLNYAAKHEHKELGSEAARSCISKYPLHVLDYAANYGQKELANEAARLTVGLPISTAASILTPPTLLKWVCIKPSLSTPRLIPVLFQAAFYDQWHSNARETLAELLLISNSNLRAAAPPEPVTGFLSSLARILDDMLEFSPARGLVICVRDPHAFYRLRSKLEHGFANQLPKQKATSMFKFLDSNFNPD